MIEDYPLGVEINYLPIVNFAIQQNNVSFIRQFALQNNTGWKLRDVHITFSASPAFLQVESYDIELIHPGEKIRIEDTLLKLEPQFLLNTGNPQYGLFHMLVTSGEEMLFDESYQVHILPYNQWNGGGVLPEILASFITPGRSVLETVLKNASTSLKEWTGNGSFDEYQSRDTDRVKKQMAAIFDILLQLNIEVDSLPVRFPEKAIPVRMADEILSCKKVNSFELALLYASCLEAAGLHPVIVLSQDTVLCGSWLTEEVFPDSVIDDVVSLSKRIEYGIDEILLIDATCIGQNETPGFENAIQQAEEKLKDENQFYYALDVRRARLSGVIPIPQRIKKGEEWYIDESEPAFKLLPGRTLHELLPVDLPDEPHDTVLTKQIIWERKLLDLSLRNNLLNLRTTKSTLQLVSVNPACFEDALADGKEFRILPMLEGRNKDWNYPGLHHILKEDPNLEEQLQNELSSHLLRSYLREMELEHALYHLYRVSRVSLEENGANTLYLALGFLKWYETGVSIKHRYAPILLLPVEIIRKSGYAIRSREEETLLNITLLEMLRQNFGIIIRGLDPLPVDESGVNVKQIFSIVRESIREQKRWEIEEEAVLGIFSFNKFIMWNDIHNNAQKLLRNDLVFSLMNGMLEWNAKDMAADAAVLDRELTPADILLPISADSSQLEAIYEAVEGTSFILHGPPGTGKSQTITNIIANALYRGKRVLFVAEKMAALSVVQSRLAALGLDPFCLELHSNKTKKSLVMQQLKRTTEVVRYKSPEEFASEAERLNELRGELNTYLDALHTTYPFGLSLYEAINLYLSDEETKEIPFPAALIPETTPERLAQWKEAIEELADIGTAFGNPSDHPLLGIKVPPYSLALKDEVDLLLQEMIRTIESIRDKIDNFNTLIEREGNVASKKQLDIVFSMICILLRIPELTSSLLLRPSLDSFLDELKEVAIQGRQRDRLFQEITTVFAPEIFRIPAGIRLQQWRLLESKWFLPRYLGQRKIKRELKDYLNLNRLDSQEVPEYLSAIICFQEKEKFVDKYSEDLFGCFGRYGRKNNEDWDVVEQIIADTAELHSMIIFYGKDVDDIISVKEALGRNLFGGIQTFKRMYGDSLEELNALHEKLEDCNLRLYRLFSIDKSVLYPDVPEWVQYTLNRLRFWKDNLDRMKDWSKWNRVEERLYELKIGFVAEMYLKEHLPENDLVKIFHKSFRKAAILYIFSQQPELETFNGSLFEAVIERYRNLTSEFQTLSRRELYARLASSLPSFTREASQNSEVGILQKNIRNNARGMSVRRLFELIPVLLERLCPCMLMSPISVAQYIDPDSEPFDLVIFDEASQMPTYEAVGAMARGKHIVVVGDPKQMPPTSFFSVNTVDEDNMEMEDLESILDDCMALSVPSKHLLWHYRSRHESLIAFSNVEYYENKLLTFPSPDNLKSKVSVVPVAGFYDKGKSRQNRQEAYAIVQEIIRRLSDKELSRRSIGVITFSIVQQTLIENRLAAVFESRPDLEKIALESEEPLFVKNLENVQGDERDIILFSIGYGPDANGKVSMNFGPLNRMGGERRLNVAVSRARYEMLIFSTLQSDMIDLNRTSAVGVAGLKRFLEYAEKGSGIRPSLQTEEVPIVSTGELVATRLRQSGYTVHTEIGCSGYKIDVGIVDEDNPSSYLLGILCDGENYRNTKTARDREIVQNSVLQGLGWIISRVWTLDWYENPDAVMERLILDIGLAKIKGIEKKKEQFAQVIVPAEPEEKVVEEIEDEDTQGGMRLYNVAVLKTPKTVSKDFFAVSNKYIILSHIRKIMEEEAPISRSLLYKRLMQIWGVNRQTQRFETYLEELIALCEVYIAIHEDIVYLWQTEEQCKTYEDYRPESNREATDLPPEEVANGVRWILREQISLPMVDLVRVTGLLFGFPRSGPNIDAAMLRGIQEAMRRGYIKLSGGKIIVGDKSRK